MAVRIRKDGRIFCAALNNHEEGDIYINDALHYHLSVIEKILVTTENEHHMSTGGEWWWKTKIPNGIIIDEFYK